jgi:hypothetical protein
MLGSRSIICVFAVGAEHSRTPPYLDGAMIAGAKKNGLSFGPLIIVGYHHRRRGNAVIGTQIVQSIGGHSGSLKDRGLSGNLLRRISKI